MLISRFYPYLGGAEIQCARLSNELARNNNHIFILTQLLPGLKKCDKIDNLPVFRVGLPLNNRVGSLSYITNGLLWLKKKVSEFDILHAHLAAAPAVLAGLARSFFKKPVILKLGGSRKTGDIGTSLATPHGKLKLAYLSKYMTHFVCPSNEIREEMLGSGFPGGRISVIPNGVDTSLFYPVEAGEKARLRESLKLPKDAKIVVFSGRFEKGKGLEVLLDIWSKLDKQYKSEGILLVLLGSGSLEAEFRSEYATVRTVRFEGWKENTADYLKAGDIFILPSFGEGLPNSLLEAMACGLICISSNIGGISEVMRDGENGLFIDPADSEGTFAVLERALSGAGAYTSLRANAGAYIQNNLSMRMIAQRYEELYGKLL